MTHPHPHPTLPLEGEGASSRSLLPLEGEGAPSPSHLSFEGEASNPYLPLEGEGTPSALAAIVTNHYGRGLDIPLWWDTFLNLITGFDSHALLRIALVPGVRVFA